MNNMKPGICDVQMSTMAKRAPRRVCGYVIILSLVDALTHHWPGTSLLLTTSKNTRQPYLNSRQCGTTLLLKQKRYAAVVWDVDTTC